MALTAAELMFRPPAAWWPTAWIASWALTGVLLAAWVLLRAAQKRDLRQIDRPPGHHPAAAAPSAYTETETATPSAYAETETATPPTCATMDQ
ncbi:hypothetical protein [Streptomyces sp. NPDC101178]|uniref:hypothetical protein n=1 Tax=Streptomyces sp. NPDC101178 TaxID=3366124 RepID=UPI00380B3477